MGLTISLQKLDGLLGSLEQFEPSGAEGVFYLPMLAHLFPPRAQLTPHPPAGRSGLSALSVHNPSAGEGPARPG
jgi:hypothetical protein